MEAQLFQAKMTEIDPPPDRATCIGIVSNESGGSNESGTGDNRAATSVHRACRDSARRWRRHRLRQGALALLEPGFAFCILHAAEIRHSASRYPRAPGVSPTQSWGQRDRVDAQPVLIAPERARPASEAAQPVPSPQTNRRRDHRWWLGGSRRHHRARLHGQLRTHWVLALFLD